MTLRTSCIVNLFWAEIFFPCVTFDSSVLEGPSCTSAFWLLGFVYALTQMIHPLEETISCIAGCVPWLLQGKTLGKLRVFAVCVGEEWKCRCNKCYDGNGSRLGSLWIYLRLSLSFLTRRAHVEIIDFYCLYAPLFVLRYSQETRRILGTVAHLVAFNNAPNKMLRVGTESRCVRYERLPQAGRISTQCRLWARTSLLKSERGRF